MPFKVALASHKEAHVILRLVTAAAVLSAGIAPVLASAQTPPQSRVEETAPRRRVMDDPAVNPGGGRQAPDIPAAALLDDGPDDDEKRTDGWAVAAWTEHAIQPSPDARRSITIPVPGPSMLLLRTGAAGSGNVTILVLKGGKRLAAFAGGSVSADGRPGTARVRVPSAGDVVIVARGPATAKLTLHVGVLAIP